MPARQNYFKLGLFVLVALAILAAMLFLLGGRSLFQPHVTIETYFNESVAGLDVGAPVRFRGVSIGRVSWIGISSQVYQRNVPLDDTKNYVVVRMRIDNFDAETGPEVLDAYVKRGLRASTQLAGITGQLFVSLDFLHGDELRTLAFDWTPNYPYIPSAPSLTNQIIANAQNFLASLNQANVQALGQNLNQLVVTLDTQMQEAKLDEIAADLRATLVTMRSAVERVDQALANGGLDRTLRSLGQATERLNVVLAEPGLRQTPQNLAAATASLRQLMESGELQRTVTRLEQAAAETKNLVGANQGDVRRAVEDLQAAAENFRSLSALLSRDPAALLFSPPPRPVVLPKETR